MKALFRESMIETYSLQWELRIVMSGKERHFTRERSFVKKRVRETSAHMVLLPQYFILAFCFCCLAMSVLKTRSLLFVSRALFES